ncbi:hypothetical protein [Modestobacter muralis]|uniref:hypothetical protein n=1 Tax=Modestobacter muralis TaxID=1608614 RepID=UPI001FE26FB0|nr:hypothetical protein [Modestobacter muralis]
MGRRGGNRGDRRDDRRPAAGSSPSRRPVQPIEQAGDGDWVVRPLTGSGSDKTYRCPGCDQEIRPGVPHVVAWPAYARDSDLEPWDTESSADWRRHWHTACWRNRDRRH